MVFSPELGYDPDEWEECPEPDHFLAFGFFTRIWLTFLTVGVAGAFFWLLEAKKEWGKIDRDATATPDAQQTAKVPPPKPERRMSLEANRAVERLRRESEESVQRLQEVGSAQRDARSSRSVERKLRKGASLTKDEVEAMLEWDRQRALLEAQTQAQTVSPEPGSHSFALPSGVFDNLTETRELEHTALQQQPPCVTPSSPGEPQDRGTIEQQYRKMAKDLEQKLLAEIEHLGLLKGLQHDHDAPRRVAEALQQRHEGEIRAAVDDLVQREAGGQRHVAEHFRRQLENQIEDAVWQYNHRLLNTETPTGRIYETELGAVEEPVWLPRDQQPEAHFQSVAAATSETTPAAPTMPQSFPVPGKVDAKAVHALFHPSPPQSPPAHAPSTLQQKGSSSSEEGFIKVEAHQTHSPDFPAGQLSPASQRPSSADAGSSVTADDIEFVEGPISPFSDVFEGDFDTLKRPDRQRVSGVSDDLDSFEQVQDVWQQHAPAHAPQGQQMPQSQTTQQPHHQHHQQLQQPQQPQFESPQKNQILQQQMPAGPQTAKKPLDPQEAEQVCLLLDEYDISVASEIAAARKSRQQAPTTQLQTQSPHQKEKQQTDSPVSPNQLGYDVIDPFSSEFALQNQQSNRKISSKSPVQSFGAGDNVAEFIFQQAAPATAATVPVSPTKQERTSSAPKTPTTPTASFQHAETRHSEDPRRLVEADIYIQDAIDYMEAQRPATSHSGGFVMEEDMLESDKASSPQGVSPAPPPATTAPTTIGAPHGAANLSELEKQLKSPSEAGLPSQQAPSADPTSRHVRTNDAFERPEASFDDADDAITSAPEIQSIEIPPDQMSENSSNYVDNLSEAHDFQPGSSGALSPAILDVFADPVLIEHKPALQRLSEQEEGRDAEQCREPPSHHHPPTQHSDRNRRELRNATGTNAESEDNLLSIESRPVSRASSGARSPEAPKLWRVSPVPDDQPPSISQASDRHAYKMRKQSSLLSVLNVTSMQEMLLRLTSLDGLVMALRRAGLESTNIIFGIDYTASNKYQGEHSFGGLSLHSVGETGQENPYQQVIRIMGNSLAPFASSGHIPVYGFGDAATGDWSVFKLREDRQCRTLDEVLSCYNQVTPTIDLSGPTNFAPLIYEAIKICQRVQDYHILVIIADGQVTNERATRKAIVHACHYPLSIIVVGVGDGPWDMMRVFDESLPKRPWDNFHFVEFHQILDAAGDGNKELAFAVQSLLEIPDQYATVRRLGLVGPPSRLSSRAD